MQLPEKAWRASTDNQIVLYFYVVQINRIAMYDQFYQFLVISDTL